MISASSSAMNPPEITAAARTSRLSFPDAAIASRASRPPRPRGRDGPDVSRSDPSTTSSAWSSSSSAQQLDSEERVARCGGEELDERRTGRRPERDLDELGDVVAGKRFERDSTPVTIDRCLEPAHVGRSRVGPRRRDHHHGHLLRARRAIAASTSRLAPSAHCTSSASSTSGAPSDRSSIEASTAPIGSLLLSSATPGNNWVTHTNRRRWSLSSADATLTSQESPACRSAWPSNADLPMPGSPTRWMAAPTARSGGQRALHRSSRAAQCVRPAAKESRLER